MAYRFPSEEWIQEYRRLLNASESYTRSGRGWEGDLTFIIEPDENYPQTAYLYLDLFHGQCRNAACLGGLEDQKPAYTVSGSYGKWRRIVEGRLDPIQALMTRQIRLKGDLMQIMRYPKAVKDMVDCVTQVPSEFAG